MGEIDPKKQAEYERQQREKEFQSFLANDPKYKEMQAYGEQLVKVQGERPGMSVTKQSDFERRAGVTPPGYEGTRDVKTGELLSQYKVDPYQSAAMRKLQEQAMAEGTSPWAKMQLESQKMQQQDERGAIGRQQMQAQGMAQAQLARSGGLRGGASALLARQGQRDLLGQRQALSRAGMGQRLGIEQQDLARKEGLLGKLGEVDVGAQQANIGQATGDINRRALFDTERYKQQMQAWGAQQSADAQRASAGGGGKK